MLRMHDNVIYLSTKKKKKIVNICCAQWRENLRYEVTAKILNLANDTRGPI